MYIEKKTWEIENEISVSPSLNLLVCGLIPQESKGQPETEWSADAGWNMLRLLLNLKLLQTWKIIELQDIFSPPLRLFSVNFGAFRQEADKTVQPYRPFFSAWHSDFPLSAFLCPAFHFGDCPQKARLVNATTVRALVEGRTWTEACSFPERITVALLAGGGPRRSAAGPQSRAWYNTEGWACSQSVSLLWGRAPEFLFPSQLEQKSSMGKRRPSHLVTHSTNYLQFSKQCSWKDPECRDG